MIGSADSHRREDCSLIIAVIEKTQLDAAYIAVLGWYLMTYILYKNDPGLVMLQTQLHMQIYTKHKANLWCPYYKGSYNVQTFCELMNAISEVHF